MSNATTIARNSLWTLLDNGLGFATSLVCSVAVARVMGPAKLGYFNYVLWVASMTGTVAALGVPLATRKYAAEHLGRGEHAMAKTIVRTTMRFQAYIATVVGVVGVTLVLLTVAPERRAWAIMAVLSIVPQLLMGVASDAITATEDQRLNVRASVISTVVNLVGVATALILRWDLPGLTGSLLVSRIIDFGLRTYYYRRVYAAFPGVPAALPPDLRRRMVKFCWQSTTLLVLDVVVWERSEMFFIQRWCDIQQVAFFSITFNIVQNLMILPRVLSWSADTTMMVQQGRAPGTVAKLGVTTMRFMALFTLPAAFGLAALADPVMRLVYGPKYLAAAPVLMITALMCLGRPLQIPAQRVLVAAETQGFLLWWGILMAAVNVTADMLIIPGGGALGAAYAKGGVQALAALGLWAYVGRRFRVSLPLGRLAALVLACGAMFGVVWAIAGALRPIVAIPVGIPVGMAVFVILLRLVRFLDPADRSRLLSLQRMMPRPMQGPFAALVDFVAPPEAASPALGAGGGA